MSVNTHLHSAMTNAVQSCEINGLSNIFGRFFALFREYDAGRFDANRPVEALAGSEHADLPPSHLLLVNGNGLEIMRGFQPVRN